MTTPKKKIKRLQMGGLPNPLEDPSAAYARGLGFGGPQPGLMAPNIPAVPNMQPGMGMPMQRPAFPGAPPADLSGLPANAARAGQMINAMKTGPLTAPPQRMGAGQEYLRDAMLGAGIGASSGSGLGTAVGGGAGLLAAYMNRRRQQRAGGGVVGKSAEAGEKKKPKKEEKKPPKKQVPKSQRGKPAAKSADNTLRLAGGGAAKQRLGYPRTRPPKKNLGNPLSGKSVALKSRGGGLAKRGMGFKGSS
jgi:hypothetical protein